MIRDGKLVQLSVSQVEVFDPKQTGGCNRRWWFERHSEREEKKSQAEGTAGHALLATYFSTGQRPAKRTLMGKAVTGAILKGDLPAVGPDLLVERRFSGQDKEDPSTCSCGHGPHAGKCTVVSCACEKFSPRWFPLDVSKTLHVGGVPFEGFIDLSFRRDDVPEIWDHKFSSDIHQYSKKNSELIETVQMPVYVLAMRRLWPDAQRWWIAHHYVSKKGVDSLIRSVCVTTDEVLEREEDITKTIQRMQSLAGAEVQTDVPYDKTQTACHAWGGCPHQSICKGFKREGIDTMTTATVSLSAEEAALFDEMEPEYEPSAEQIHDPEPEPIQAPAVAPAAAVTPPARPRMMQVPTGAVVPPPQASQATAIVPTHCRCGIAITTENGSQLRDGSWKHVSCPLDAPPVQPAAPAPAVPRRGRKPKDPNAPQSLAALVQAATPTPEPVAPVALAAASPAPAQPAAPVAPAKPEPVAHAGSPVVLSAASFPPVAVASRGFAPAPIPDTRDALATLFDSIAALIRSGGR